MTNVAPINFRAPVLRLSVRRRDAQREDVADLLRRQAVTFRVVANATKSPLHFSRLLFAHKGCLMRKKTEQTNSFDVVDAAGTVRTVVEWTEYIEGGGMGGAQWIPGLLEYRFAGGSSLNKLNDRAFECVLTGTRWVRR